MDKMSVTVLLVVQYGTIFRQFMCIDLEKCLVSDLFSLWCDLVRRSTWSALF